MKSNIIAVGIALVVLGAVFVWLNNESSAKNEVRVGGLFGLTGFASFAGETSRNGFIMALEDTGHDPSEYPIEDFHSDLKTTVIGATKLLVVDGVNVVIGPEWAEFSEVVVPLANEHKALFISPWMTGEGARLQSPYYFSATPTERTHVQKVLKHMVTAGVTNVALIYSDNAYAIGFQEIIRDELSKNYPSLHIVFESKAGQDATDYRTELVKVRATNADALYAVMATGISANAVIRQSKELGVSFSIYMPFSAISQLKPEDRAGSGADGILYAVNKESTRTAEFNAKYKERFGVEPTAITGATTYDMTVLVLEAIDEGARTPEDVTKYLQGVKNYRGYSNVISFGADGHVVSGAVELRETKGESYTVVE